MVKMNAASSLFFEIRIIHRIYTADEPKNITSNVNQVLSILTHSVHFTSVSLSLYLDFIAATPCVCFSCLCICLCTNIRDRHNFLCKFILCIEESASDSVMYSTRINQWNFIECLKNIDSLKEVKVFLLGMKRTSLYRWKRTFSNKYIMFFWAKSILSRFKPNFGSVRIKSRVYFGSEKKKKCV